MREILFRGKKEHDSEWVYGWYREDCDGKAEIISNKDYYSFYVDPETVGQFTGLMDKNKTKGFEGDIVSSGSSTGVIVFSCGKFAIRWIVNKDFWSDTILLHLPNCDIIGNRWDNPELLEVDKNA